MRGRNQNGCKRFTPPLVAAYGQRTQGVAVVTLFARDEMGALRLADLDKILARHLECGLDRLGTAADKIHMTHALRRGTDQLVCQFFRHLGGEKTGVCISQLVDLRMHGGQHVRVPMAQAGHGRATRGIDVSLALRIGQVDALPADGHRRLALQLAMKHMGGRCSHKTYFLDEE